MVVRAVIFNGHVMTLNEAGSGEAGAKGGYAVLGRARGPTVSHHWGWRLLHKRDTPRHGRRHQTCVELPSSHMQSLELFQGSLARWRL